MSQLVRDRASAVVSAICQGSSGILGKLARSAMSADGICRRKLNSAMPIGHEPSDKIKLGASHRKMADPLKRLHGESQLCSTQAIFHKIKNCAFSRQFQIFSSETIIIILSSCQQLFRNFQKDYSATIRYCAAHFVKNALISSSGILIPHLSGSFRVIFP